MNILNIVPLLTSGFVLYKWFMNKKYRKTFLKMKSLIEDDNLINLYEFLPQDQFKGKVFLFNVYNDHDTIKISLLVDTCFDQLRVINFTNELTVKLTPEYSIYIDDFTDQQRDELEFEGFYINVIEL